MVVVVVAVDFVMKKKEAPQIQHSMTAEWSAEPYPGSARRGDKDDTRR